jgi:hypothetical protein
MDALNGGAIGLRFPPVFDRQDERFGHVGFMHIGLREE